MNELLEDSIDLILYHCAHDVGIFPKSRTQNGITTYRSQWEEGWNAACITISKRNNKFVSWFKELKDTMKEEIAYLLLEEILYLDLNEEREVIMNLNMNDVFAYACAESETIEFYEINIITKLHEEFGMGGVVAYVASKYGIDPISPHQTEEYYKSLLYIENFYKNRGKE